MCLVRLLPLLLLPAPALPGAAGVPAPRETPPHRRYGGWNSGRIGGGGYLQQVVFSPADAGRLYLAVDVGGCYRSDDGGRTWRMLHGALPATEGAFCVRGIAAHPADPGTLLIATGGSSLAPPRHGVYRSDDAGETFRLTLRGAFDGNDSTRNCGFVLAADPAMPLRVYAAPIGGGLHRSDDFGATWRGIPAPTVYPQDLVVDRAAGGRIWLNGADRGDRLREVQGTKAPFQHGLFVTADGGATWERLPGDETPTEMVQDPLDAALLHAAFRKAPQLRRSRDGGRTWEPYANADILPAPGGAREDGTYAALAAGPDFILAAGHGGHFYRLAAGGDTWTKLPDPAVHEGDWYAALTVPVERHFGAALGFVAVSPHDPARWAFTDWYACYLSPDAGASWHLAVDGIEATVFHCLAQDPSAPLRVHAGVADLGYFRSDDGGETFPLWGRLRGIGNNIKHIAVCARRPDRLYAVGPARWHWHANQVFRSDDGGLAWRRPAQRGLPSLADDGGARCNTIAVHPGKPDEVYLAVSGAVAPGGGGVYRSFNAGDDWEWIGEGLPTQPLFRESIWVSGPELAVSGDGALVAMANDRGRGFVYDRGTRRWRELALPGHAHCLVADMTTPGRFYLGMRHAGAYRSDDGGRTWRNICGSHAAAVTADQACAGRVALWTGDAAWLSTDAGENWISLPSGPPYRHFRNVLCFAGDRLLCGTGGSGVFWTGLADAAGKPEPRKTPRTFGLKP